MKQLCQLDLAPPGDLGKHRDTHTSMQAEDINILGSNFMNAIFTLILNLTPP